MIGPPETGSKIGIHAQKTTFFDHLRQAAAQGVPFPAAKLTQEQTALADVKRDSPDTLTVGRAPHEQDALEGIADEPRMSDDRAMEWAVVIMGYAFEYLGLNPDLVEFIDVWELCNEPDPDTVDGWYNLGLIMRKCVQLGRERYPSIAWGIGSFNMGTPEYDEAAAFIESGVLNEVQHGDVVLCVHEGTEKPTDPIEKGYGDLIPGAPSVPEHGGAHFGRIAYFAQIAGDKMPPVIVTETYMHAYGDTLEIRRRAEWVDALYSQLPYVVAWLPYTHSPTNAWKHQDYTPAYPSLIEYAESVRDRQNATPPPPDDPPDDGLWYKSIAVLAPQDYTLEQMIELRRRNYDNRRTITQSLDEALQLRRLGKEGSYTIAYDIDRWRAEERALVTGGLHELRTLNPLAQLSLSMPLTGPFVISSRFNAPRDYDGDGQHDELHEGIDLAPRSSGALCIAPAPGIVEHVGFSATGYGHYVRLRHQFGPLVAKTWLAHMKAAPEVSVGQTVTAGQRLGLVGSSGNSSGDHVHLTLEVPGHGLGGYVVRDVVNPEPFIDLAEISPPSTAPLIDLRRFKIADPDCWRVVRHVDGNGHETSEDIQDMQLGNGLWVRRKNANAEWHMVDSEFFYLVHDTSPAPGGEGVARVYTLYKNGIPGAPKSRIQQRIGEQWVEDGRHFVQFRARGDCRNLSENSGEAQNRSVITRYETDYIFNRYGQNIRVDEAIWEQTGVETQIYCRKDGKSLGWCGWISPWGETELVEVHWDRSRMTQEPDRVCGW